MAEALPDNGSDGTSDDEAYNDLLHQLSRRGFTPEEPPHGGEYSIPVPALCGGSRRPAVS